jgi:hypothetical protein
VQGNESVAQVVSALAYTGIRNIREEATHADTGTYSNFCAVHAQSGASVDMIGITDDGTMPNSSCVVSPSTPYCGNMADEKYAMEQLAACGALVQVEGPNEPNNEPFTYIGGQYACNSSDWTGCGQYMKDLFAMVHSDPKLAGILVADLTEGGAEVNNVGVQFLTIPSGQATIYPAGTQFADLANLHNYYDKNPLQDNQVWFAEAPTGPECTPSNCFDGINGEYIGATWGGGFAAYPVGTNLPRVTTESGASTTNDETPDQQAKTLVTLFLDGAARGFIRTYMYTMFDEVSDGTTFGLIGSDHATPKLSGTYLHNLTKILADTSSAFTPTAIGYSISDMPSTGHSMLLQKSDGTYDLVVWGEAFGSGRTSSITVNLGASYGTVKIYDVTVGPTPAQTLSGASSVSLMINDHPLIVEFK